MSLADDLERLAALHRSGALSDAEFASAKARAIAGGPGAGSPGGSWLSAWRRSRTDRWLGGVCGGLAPVSGLPAWMWRLVVLALVLCGGTGVLLYLLLWLVLPADDGVVADAAARTVAG